MGGGAAGAPCSMSAVGTPPACSLVFCIVTRQSQSLSPTAMPCPCCYGLPLSLCIQLVCPHPDWLPACCACRARLAGLCLTEEYSTLRTLLRIPGGNPFSVRQETVQVGATCTEVTGILVSEWVSGGAKKVPKGAVHFGGSLSLEAAA